jgi:hypothetical protein
MLHRQTANAGLLALPPMTAQIATALGPALDEPVALQQPSTVHVSEGSLARITAVQFWQPVLLSQQTLGSGWREIAREARRLTLSTV